MGFQTSLSMISSVSGSVAAATRCFFFAFIGAAAMRTFVDHRPTTPHYTILSLRSTLPHEHGGEGGKKVVLTRYAARHIGSAYTLRSTPHSHA